MRPVFRYLGSKWRVAEWILSYLPPHGGYVEPFGGSASVLMQKPRCLIEVINDLDDDVVNVFQVLRSPDQAEQLRQLIELTPFARAELRNCTDRSVTDPVERARRTIARSFMGFGADAVTRDIVTGFRIRRLHEGRRSSAQTWAGYPDHIPAFVERLSGVIIENKPALEIIETFDHPNLVFYVDPPYVHSTRGKRLHTYRHELDDSDHEKLLEVLANVSGMVLLSGYDHEMYRNALKDWQCVELETHADQAMPRTEYLWMNPAAMETRTVQNSLF